MIRCIKNIPTLASIQPYLVGSKLGISRARIGLDLYGFTGASGASQCIPITQVTSTMWLVIFSEVCRLTIILAV